ncbi:MAG TPA: thioredoxin-dependent thiol peroxidase [Phototrophicaceae bacterium]|jgi:peroxiredoxin Q/BCP|nr:thioredoxin-dependent thiol peroxidase [Phototrophicaceae bacterium]
MMVDSAKNPVPQAGETAPDFKVMKDEGAALRLSDFRGKTVVLYFYPKADTPGCTRQACNFRDNYQLLRQIDVVVLGASPDTVEEQKAFKEKYNLPFTLLADHDHAVADRYGLWGTHKILYQGVEYETHGVRRSTFIINPDGVIVSSKFGVDPASNTTEVLDILNRIVNSKD